MKIDKGIPIPPRSRRAKYPWAKMQVGDSILIRKLPITSVTPQATRAGRALGATFECHGVKDGVRVWRVK